MKRAVLALVVLGYAAPAARADTDTDAAALKPLPSDAKKAQFLAAKSASATTAEAKAAWEARLRERIGKKPEPVVNIFNTWTHETVAVEVDPKKVSIGAVRRALDGVRDRVNDLANEALRCHFTNKPTEMDPRLFRVIVEAARHFGVERVEIISGFRASKYNLSLRKKGHQVARNSQHTLGHAVDFRLPGVGTRRLRNFARALHLGGVGYYPKSGFVHVDVGRIRSWRGD